MKGTIYVNCTNDDFCRPISTNISPAAATGGLGAQNNVIHKTTQSRTGNNLKSVTNTEHCRCMLYKELMMLELGHMPWLAHLVH